MRRRVSAAVIVSVVVALALAGLGTLVLSRAAARRSAEADLRRQAGVVADLAAALGTANQPDAEGNPRLSVTSLRRMSDAFDLHDIGAVIVGPEGRSRGELPAGVTLTPAEEETVRAGGLVSGESAGGRLYAATGRSVGPAVIVVGMTGTTRGLLSGPAGWFVISSALVVALAVGVGLWLGSRLARPVRDATAVTERIAAGDLDARLPDPFPGAGDETAVLARSINAMADALARSRGLEQQFLMSVSHDLRTPLTNIRGYAEAIADGATAPGDGARVISRESDRLERLVRDLLDLARLDARQFTLHPRPVDVGSVVADAAESHRAELAAAGLSLVVQADAGLTGTVDPDRLAQVVGNLVGNATRFAAGAVTVTASGEPAESAESAGDPSATTGHRSVVVHVINDGTPIDAADLPFVFERLYQGRRRPTRSESGSGLGLAIVRELVTAMGGTVGVHAPADGGTAFWFRVPLTPVAPPANL